MVRCTDHYAGRGNALFYLFSDEGIEVIAGFEDARLVLSLCEVAKCRLLKASLSAWYSMR